MFKKTFAFSEILNRISTLKGKRLAGSAEERGGESLMAVTNGEGKEDTLQRAQNMPLGSSHSRAPG